MYKSYIHSTLIGFFIPFSIYANNISEIRIRELIIPLVVILLVNLVMLLIVRLFNKDSRIANHPEVKDSEIIKTIEAEIKKAMVGKEKVLTSEQQEIKELKAQMAELVASKKDGPKKTNIGNPVIVDKELTAARVKYEEVFKKKPHHKSTIDNINKAIEEKLNENGGAE